MSDFYRDGLRGFGLESDGIPMERDGGKLALHLVRGKLPASRYHHDSGDVTRAEIREAMKRTFDLDREFVLVFYAPLPQGARRPVRLRRPLLRHRRREVGPLPRGGLRAARPGAAP